MDTHFAETGLKRLDLAGLTLATAFVRDDRTLLRMPSIGRKTLRFIRTYNGPRLPVPAIFKRPEPMQHDYKDAAGYIDYEAYDQDWMNWNYYDNKGAK